MSLENSSYCDACSVMRIKDVLCVEYYISNGNQYLILGCKCKRSKFKAIFFFIAFFFVNLTLCIILRVYFIFSIKFENGDMSR